MVGVHEWPVLVHFPDDTPSKVHTLRENPTPGGRVDIPGDERPWFAAKIAYPLDGDPFGKYEGEDYAIEVCVEEARTRSLAVFRELTL